MDGETDDIVDCNMCGYMMYYNEECGIYECTNSECTRCTLEFND